MIPRTIKNFNAFVDGRSYFGLCSEAKLPEVKLSTEAIRNAGMDGPLGVDMGTEGMTAEVTFSEHRPELIKLFGTLPRLVLRPAQLDNAGTGTANTIIVTIGGLVTGLPRGDLKVGANAPLKLTWDVRYYREEFDGEELIEIDLPNGVRKVGGVDQLAAMRRAMGV